MWITQYAKHLIEPYLKGYDSIVSVVSHFFPRFQFYKNVNCKKNILFIFLYRTVDRVNIQQNLCITIYSFFIQILDELPIPTRILIEIIATISIRSLKFAKSMKHSLFKAIN